MSIKCSNMNIIDDLKEYSTENQENVFLKFYLELNGIKDFLIVNLKVFDVFVGNGYLLFNSKKGNDISMINLADIVSMEVIKK